MSVSQEEYRRNGLQEAPGPPDPGKPSPKEVLETFSLGTDYEKKLTELYERPKSSSVLTPLEKDERLVQSLTSSANEANKIGVGCSDGESLKHVKETGRTNSDSFALLHLKIMTKCLLKERMWSQDCLWMKFK